MSKIKSAEEIFSKAIGLDITSEDCYKVYLLKDTLILGIKALERHYSQFPCYGYSREQMENYGNEYYRVGCDLDSGIEYLPSIPSPCAYNTEIKKGKDLKEGDTFWLGDKWEENISKEFVIGIGTSERYKDKSYIVQVSPTEQKPLTFEEWKECNSW